MVNPGTKSNTLPKAMVKRPRKKEFFEFGTKNFLINPNCEIKDEYAFKKAALL